MGYYVAGPPLLNGRCTSLLRAPRLRSDLYCVEWDVKLYYTVPYPQCLLQIGARTEVMLDSYERRVSSVPSFNNGFYVAEFRNRCTDFYFRIRIEETTAKWFCIFVPPSSLPVMIAGGWSAGWGLDPPENM